ASRSVMRLHGLLCILFVGLGCQHPRHRPAGLEDPKGRTGTACLAPNGQGSTSPVINALVPEQAPDEETRKKLFHTRRSKPASAVCPGPAPLPVEDMFLVPQVVYVPYTPYPHGLARAPRLITVTPTGGAGQFIAYPTTVVGYTLVPVTPGGPACP